MPRKTDGEKIDEIDRLTATLMERTSFLGRDDEVLRGAHKELARAVEELGREVLLLKRELESLKNGRDLWGQRLWMVLAPLAAGSAGIALSYYLGVKR